MATTMNSSSSSILLLDAIIPQTAWTPWYHSYAPSLIPGIPDEAFALMTPILAYWSLSVFFHLLDTYSERAPFKWLGVEQYRIHESDEMKTRNKATPAQVLGAVIFQQVVQTAMGAWWLAEPHVPELGAVEERILAMRRISPWLIHFAKLLLGDVTATRFLQSYGHIVVYCAYWWIIPAFQFLLAFFVIDTWQYFLHRLMHVNKFLYKHLHSVHHRLYVPYAYGALYNHPIEGFLLDTCGAVIAEAVAFLTVRQTALLFGFSAAKTVDDHCGFSLPWDPLQFMYKNNVRYHDVHHQHYGLKYNFSQPFWIHWDIVMGTRWDKPARPLAAEKRAMALRAREQKEDRLPQSPASDSDVSSDSGIAMVNKED